MKRKFEITNPDFDLSPLTGMTRKHYLDLVFIMKMQGKFKIIVVAPFNLNWRSYVKIQVFVHYSVHKYSINFFCKYSINHCKNTICSNLKSAFNL